MHVMIASIGVTAVCSSFGIEPHTACDMSNMFWWEESGPILCRRNSSDEDSFFSGMRRGVDVCVCVCVCGRGCMCVRALISLPGVHAFATVPGTRGTGRTCRCRSGELSSPRTVSCADTRHTPNRSTQRAYHPPRQARARLRTAWRAFPWASWGSGQCKSGTRQT